MRRSSRIIALAIVGAILSVGTAGAATARPVVVLSGGTTCCRSAQ